MTYKDAYMLWEGLKEHPIKTLMLTAVAILITLITYYFLAFTGEKAKQLVNSPKELSTRNQHQGVTQKTEGDQSPAVISEGGVNIEFGGDK